jgi:transcriptional regulator with XRE-family HTH domain
MWLDRLKELKKEKGWSYKQISEEAGLTERTVTRIYSGDTPTPYADTLYRLASAFGVSLDDILADGKVVVGGKSLITLQEEVDRLTAENAQITAENAILAAENAMLKDKVAVISTENDILRVKLEHKEEIVRLHDYYTSLIGGLTREKV